MLKDTIIAHRKRDAELQAEIDALDGEIKGHQATLDKIKAQLKSLRGKTVETDTAKDSINHMLRDSGMRGFSLQPKAGVDNVYEVRRPDGTIADNLSEGEKNFITPATRDGGKDIIATKYEMGKPVVFYIECKRYGREQKVGVAAVQRLYGVQTDDKINKAVLVTTSRFTSVARRFAERQKTLIDLYDVDEFYALLEKSAEKYRNEYPNTDWS